MRKKILSLLLAICIILPSAMVMVGCNNGEEPQKTLESWQISNAELKLILTQDYDIRTRNFDAFDDGDLMRFSFDKQGAYTEYNLVIKDSSSVDTSGRKDISLKKYHAINQYYVYENGEGGLVDEDTFNSYNVETLYQTYSGLNAFIIDNYDKFSDITWENSGKGDENYLDVPKVYSCDVAQINDLSSQIANLNIDRIIIYRDINEGIAVRYWMGNKFWEIFYENPLQSALDNLLNHEFCIIGGPSETDVDYAEYYFDGNNGFRMYTPNNTAIADRTDIYYKK